MHVSKEPQSKAFTINQSNRTSLYVSMRVTAQDKHYSWNFQFSPNEQLMRLQWTCNLYRIKSVHPKACHTYCQQRGGALRSKNHNTDREG